MDFLLDRDWNQPVRYPDPAIEVLDPRFAPYVTGSAALERLWTGARWAEGPVWFGDQQRLLFSDIPNDRIMGWSAIDGSMSVFRQAPTMPTATPEIGRVAWSHVSMAAGSRERKSTGPLPCCWRPSKVSG